MKNVKPKKKKGKPKKQKTEEKPEKEEVDKEEKAGLNLPSFEEYSKITGDVDVDI